MKTHHWNNSETGTHCYAESPFYSIHMNGKVDINPNQGTSDNKIELHVAGMYQLVKDWLDSGHQLTEVERANLIDSIAIRGKKIYNTVTKEWETKE